MKDSNTKVFILDEMGIGNIIFKYIIINEGTKPLRHYGYSKVNTPCVLQRK